MKKKSIIAGLAGITAFSGAAYAFADYIYRISTKPHQHTDEDSDFDPLITEGRMFVRNHPDRKDLYTTATDNIQLHASYIPARDNDHKIAIIIHGIWDNHESVGIYAKHYLENGISCLLPDLRGFGKSEGEYIGYGLSDRLDIKEWISYLIKNYPDSKIIIHGMSMGAATTLMTCGEYLPANVKCAISDSSFTTLREQFAATYKTFKGSVVPIPIALLLAKIIIFIRAGYNIDDVNCIGAVRRSTTPILFIHGDDDTFIDPHMCSRLYEAASCKKSYCIIPGARHIEGVVKDPDKYWCKISAFISRYCI